MRNLQVVYLCFFVFSLMSCSGDDSEPPVVIQKPNYSFNKEKVYFGEYHTYADVLKPYYYQFTVTQLNPNVSVPQARLKEMEDSVNNVLQVSASGHIFYLKNVGIEINGNPVDVPMQLNVDEEKREKYISLGRDGLIDIWEKNKILNLFTTFEDFPGVFDLRLRTRTSTDYDDLLMSFRETDLGIQVNALDCFKLVDEKPADIPTLNLTEYYWTYDRFNDRTYTDDEGNTYLTKVVVKKMEEVTGYDDSITLPSNWWNSFDLTETYPIIQIYKGDELWFEGKIYKYTEEHEEWNDGVDTILNFDAHTKRDGYYWELYYEWVGFSRFQLRKLDFTKPTEYADFTEVETTNIKIVKDEKEGHKGTGSFDNGKGKTFNFNAAY